MIFYAANLKGSDFKNAQFKNVFFINTDLSEAKNISVDDANIQILNGECKLEISEALEVIIMKLMNIEKIRKHYVLTTKVSKGRKINNWILYLLKENYSEEELIKGFTRIYSNDTLNSNKLFFTYYSFFDFFWKYLKKDDRLKLSCPGTV